MEGYGTPNATDGSTQSKQTSQSKRRTNVFVHKFWPLWTRDSQPGPFLVELSTESSLNPW